MFLETLEKHAEEKDEDFSVAFLELLDATYNFSASKNAEVKLRWQTLCINSEAAWILPQVVEFITSQGRMKFVRPLYRLLRASDMGKQIAIDTFEAKQNMYGSNAVV